VLPQPKHIFAPFVEFLSNLSNQNIILQENYNINLELGNMFSNHIKYCLLQDKDSVKKK